MNIVCGCTFFFHVNCIQYCNILLQKCLLLSGNISGWTWEEIYTRLLSVQNRNDTDMKVQIKIPGRTLDIPVLIGGITTKRCKSVLENIHGY